MLGAAQIFRSWRLLCNRLGWPECECHLHESHWQLHCFVTATVKYKYTYYKYRIFKYSCLVRFFLVSVLMRKSRLNKRQKPTCSFRNGQQGYVERIHSNHETVKVITNSSQKRLKGRNNISKIFRMISILLAWLMSLNRWASASIFNRHWEWSVGHRA